MKIQKRSLPLKILAVLEGEAKREFEKIVLVGTSAIKYILEKGPSHPDEEAMKTHTIAAPLLKSDHPLKHVEVPEAVRPVVDEAKNWDKDDFVFLTSGEKSDQEKEAEEEAEGAERRREDHWVLVYNQEKSKGFNQEEAARRANETPSYRRLLLSATVANKKKMNVHDHWRQMREKVTGAWLKAKPLMEKEPLLDSMYKDPAEVWEIANRDDHERPIPLSDDQPGD